MMARASRQAGLCGLSVGGMKVTRSERLAGTGGLLFTVLAIFGHDVLAGESDTLAMHSSPASIATYLANRPITPQIWAGWYVELLGFLALVFFLGSMWSILRRAQGEPGTLSTIAFGAGLLALGMKFVSAVPVIAAYSRGREAFAPQVLAVHIDMGNVAFVLTLALWAVFLAPVAIVVIRTGILPRWLGWAAAALAAGLLVAVAFITSSLASVPWLLFLLWVPATGVAVARGSRLPVGRTVAVAATA
jgi:hypothetical protein